MSGISLYRGKSHFHSPLFQPNIQRNNRLGNLTIVLAAMLPGYKKNQDGGLFTELFLRGLLHDCLVFPCHKQLQDIEKLLQALFLRSYFIEIRINCAIY